MALVADEDQQQRENHLTEAEKLERPDEEPQRNQWRDEGAKEAHHEDGRAPAGQPQGVAPDGGWGWVVAASVAFNSVVMLSSAISYPFVFADYLAELGHGTEAMTTIVSVCMCISSFSGLLCNQLFRRFSYRQIALAGAVFFVLGQGPVALATSFTHFILSSLCLGIGIGLIMPATFTCFNSYFDRRRTFVMGLVQFVVGLGTVGIPVMAQRLVASVGFRMTQGILFAISLLLFPGMAVMRPIKYSESYQSVESNEESSAQAGNPEETCEENQTGTKKGSVIDLVEAKFVHDFITRSTENVNYSRLNTSDDNAEKREGSDEQKCDLLQKGRNAKEVDKVNSDSKTTQRGGSSLRPRVSVTSVVSAPFPDSVGNKSQTSSKSWWLTVVDLFDLRLLQDLRCTNILVGTALSMFVDMVFCTLLPLYLFHNEFSREDSALCISVMGIADLVGRFSVAVLGACCVPDNRLVFLLSSAATLVIRALYIFFTDFMAIAVLCALLGFCKCFMFVLAPLVVADSCSQERFPAALGIQTVMGGVMTVAFGPAIGKVRDVTGSFTASFIAITVLGLFCVAPWTLEMVVTAVRRRRKVINK
ncbi:monocarboxylate transporter 13-like [Schistocerca gregaria]|uniref:monocarboxylate transporter 13-like n=1 Tax=Schistocerca gregaria TaxID=7010 RepID=UPI00211EC24D|nr:monocarboxylate transporter 13-like [Schistocerca gregaria]